MGSQLNVISYLNIIRPTDATQSKQTSTLYKDSWSRSELSSQSVSPRPQCDTVSIKAL